MASYEYTITTDAFSLAGFSYPAETLNFTVPYSTDGTFSLAGLNFDGTPLGSVTVSPSNFGVSLTILGADTGYDPKIPGEFGSLGTGTIQLPTVSGETTTHSQIFDVLIRVSDTSAPSAFVPGNLAVTGISLPEPTSFLLLLPALAYICLRSPSGLSNLVRRALGSTCSP